MEEEIYLTRPQRESLREYFPRLAGLYESSPYVFETIPPQQLFAPERFVLGHFVEMDRGALVLSGSLYFTKNPGDLDKYQSGIDRNRLEIMKRIRVSQDDINEIMWKSERYIDFRESTSCGREAFLMRFLGNNENDFAQSLLNTLNEVEVR